MGGASSATNANSCKVAKSGKNTESAPPVQFARVSAFAFYVEDTLHTIEFEYSANGRRRVVVIVPFQEPREVHFRKPALLPHHGNDPIRFKIGKHDMELTLSPDPSNPGVSNASLLIDGRPLKEYHEEYWRRALFWQFAEKPLPLDARSEVSVAAELVMSSSTAASSLRSFVSSASASSMENMTELLSAGASSRERGGSNSSAATTVTASPPSANATISQNPSPATADRSLEPNDRKLAPLATSQSRDSLAGIAAPSALASPSSHSHSHSHSQNSNLRLNTSLEPFGGSGSGAGDAMSLQSPTHGEEHRLEHSCVLLVGDSSKVIVDGLKVDTVSEFIDGGSLHSFELDEGQLRCTITIFSSSESPHGVSASAATSASADKSSSAAASASDTKAQRPHLPRATSSRGSAPRFELRVNGKLIAPSPPLEHTYEMPCPSFPREEQLSGRVIAGTPQSSPLPGTHHIRSWSSHHDLRAAAAAAAVASSVAASQTHPDRPASVSGGSTAASASVSQALAVPRPASVL